MDSFDQHQIFVRWLLAATLMMIMVVGILNWIVDPTGVTGRKTRWQIADNTMVRSAKLDLYERALKRADKPDVLLLGSSRTMKFNPATVEKLTGLRTFNAAVSGGVPQDAWLFMQLVKEHQKGDDFPHLVWGLDADAFRTKRVRDGLATDPRVSKFVPWSDRVAIKIASLGTLTEMQTLQATMRSLRAGGNADDTGKRLFDNNGMQLYSRRFEKRAVLRNRAIRRQTTNYANFVFERDGWDRVEDGPLEEFKSVIRIANRHGDTPTIFITPYHPIAEAQLAKYDLVRRRKEVLDRLKSLQAKGDLSFELVDLSDPATFGADDAEWYDGVHMREANTDRALRYLADRRLLTP